MNAATRPFAAAGVALMSAGFIAATPAIAPTTSALPQVHIPDVVLQASIFDIFTFPAYQQALLNEVEFVAIRAAGLAETAQGLAQSVFALPETVITAVQQTFSGNPLGALDTVEEWAIQSATDTFVPVIAANIEVGQIQLAIQSAALVAQPLALVSLGNGLLGAFDAVSRSLIIATQNLIDALGTFNIGNIVNAVVDGIGDVVDGFVTGGQSLVDGIVGAQTLIADALKARPVQALSAAAAAPVAAAPVAAAPAAERNDTVAETLEPQKVDVPTTSDASDAAAKPARAQRGAVPHRASARSAAAQADDADSAGKAASAEDSAKPSASRRGGASRR
ncbi:hypothetical protein [Mycolicibacterium sp.]|uniref:hypothetical protein n=1 Tax=Mycolicibacterium sp. TaxID=2320850 RepID=UPI0025E78E4A|nr:hypothetical protein [Mycolicibacterium sp.]MCB9408937.1 hypothetical protein [Mycolicibacterium sp.]